MSDRFPHVGFVKFKIIYNWLTLYHIEVESHYVGLQSYFQNDFDDSSLGIFFKKKKKMRALSFRMRANQI